MLTDLHHLTYSNKEIENAFRVQELLVVQVQCLQ